MIDPLQQESLRAFYASLSASSRSPLAAVQTGLPQAMRKGNYDEADFAIRRACKFGLEYFLMEKKVRVHFVIDPPTWAHQMDPLRYDRDVVEREWRDNRVPITTSELRCCYRNKERWIPTGRLKFYKDLHEVEPPWVSNPAIWGQYAVARHIKRHPVLSTVSRWFIRG
jgi:hypothetical protein